MTESEIAKCKCLAEVHPGLQRTRLIRHCSRQAPDRCALYQTAVRSGFRAALVAANEQELLLFRSFGQAFVQPVAFHQKIVVILKEKNANNIDVVQNVAQCTRPRHGVIVVNMVDDLLFTGAVFRTGVNGLRPHEQREKKQVKWLHTWCLSQPKQIGGLQSIFVSNNLATIPYSGARMNPGGVVIHP